LKIRKNSSSNITPALYSYTLGVKVKKSWIYQQYKRKDF
jgi:hypothetical protein